MQFLAKLASIAKVAPEDLSDGVAIAPREWDSVDLLDVLATIDEAYGVTVEPKQVGACRTVGELHALIAAAQERP